MGNRARLFGILALLFTGCGFSNLEGLPESAEEHAVEAEPGPRGIQNLVTDSPERVLCTLIEDEKPLEDVIAVLDLDPDLNAHGSCGMAAVHWAAFTENMTVLEELADRGADCNLPSGVGIDENGCREIVDFFDDFGKLTTFESWETRGRTPLHWAVRAKWAAGVRYLLSRGVDVDRLDSEDRTPLHFAAGMGRAGIVKALLQAGADPNLRDGWDRTPLHYAVETLFACDCQLLLDAGARIDVVDCEGNRPLHMLARIGFPKTIPLLVRAGADVNASGAGGWNPLEMAIQGCKIFHERALRKHGAKVSDRNEAYLRLCEAIRYGWHPSKARAALEAGAGVDRRDMYGWTPLRSAVSRGREEIARELLARGADWSGTRDGETLLHVAARLGRVSLVRLVLETGLDVNARCDKGMTPLACAAAKDRSSVVSFLLSRGADPHVADEDGQTALHLSVIGANEKVVGLLLGSGADPHVADEDGDTPVKLAQKDRDVAVIFSRHGIDVGR